MPLQVTSANRKDIREHRGSVPEASLEGALIAGRTKGGG